jgi:hypothetical protein
MVSSLCSDEKPQSADASIASSVVGKIASLFTTGRSANDETAFSSAVSNTVRDLRVDHKMTPLQAFRWTVRNWKNLRDSPIWKHVSNLLAIGIATGFAPEKWGTLELGTVKIFQIVHQDRYSDAFSIIDGIMNATEYFVEAAVASWEVGNFLPFFFEKHMVNKLDELFEEIQDSVPRALQGELGSVGNKWSELVWKIERCTSAFREARNCAPARSIHRKILSDRVQLLESWRFQLISCVKAGDVVAQPFANITVGPPRCGKTRITKDLIKIHSVVYGITFSEEKVANMVSGDEYHSQVHNHTVYLVYDDVAANKPKYDKAMGIVGIIQSVNNMRFVAVKAEAELKGRVMPELGAVFGTTNTDHMNASVFASSLPAIWQRYVLTRMHTRPEYSNVEGGVNGSKVRLSPPAQVEFGGIKYDDVSRFDICISDGGPHRVATVSDATTGATITLSNLNVAEYYYWMERIMANHIADQKEHVARIKGTNFSMCTTCNRICCICPKPEEQQGGTETPDVHNMVLTPIPEDSAEDDDDIISDDLDSFVKPHPHWLDAGMFSRTADDLGLSVEELMDPRSVFDDDEQIQGFFADAVFHGVKHGVKNFVLPTPEPMLFSFARNASNPLWWHATSSNLTQELLSFSMTSPSIQWWYWIPESWWNSDIVVHCANQLQDDALREDIRLLAVWYFRTRCFLCIISIVSVFFFSFIGVLLFVVPVFIYIYCRFSYLDNYYRTCAHAILSERRDLMGHLRDSHYAAMSEPFKLLLKCVSGALAAYATYSGINYLYKEFFVDEPRDAPDDMPLCVEYTREQSQSCASPMPSGAVNTWGAPVELPPVSSGASVLTMDENNLISSSFNPPSVVAASRVDSQKSKGLTPSEAKQGFMSVTSDAIEAREKEISPWQQMVIKKRATYKPPNGMTSAQFISKVNKGSVAVFRKNELDEWSYHCNAYFYDTNLAIMCVADKASYTQQWLLVANESPHARREITVSKGDFIPMNCGRLCTARITFSSFAAKRTFFNTNPGILKANFMMRLENGRLSKPVPVTGVRNPDANCQSRIKWKFPFETRVGMCGGVYISPDDKCLLGVHYAGLTTDLTYGFSACPSADDFVAVDTYYVSQVGVILSNSIDPDDHHVVINQQQQVIPSQLQDGNLADQAEWLGENKDGYPSTPSIPNVTMYDDLAPEETKQGFPGLPPEPLDLVSLIEPAPDEIFQGAQYIGRRDTAAFYKTSVVPTAIKDDIYDAFPDLPDYGGPRFGKWMWGRGAAHALRSTPGVPREHLEWAVKDWLYIFKQHRLPSGLRKYLRPLTWDEVLNGIDGVKFIDAMNKSTSAGPGFPGSKRQWINSYLDTLTGFERYAFLQEVWDQVAHALKQFEAGVRVPFLFIATPKDEPTPATKEKVRLFMVGEIAAIILCRKYYTPVLRIMQMLPGWSECCVGLNATSPHWEDLWARFSTFEHVFDGDYSKYDVSMNANINMASYWCMMQIATLGNYSSHDLYIMNCIAVEFCLPLAAYKKEVWLLPGSTPSGVPVTVNVNGISNSLLNRCAYKHAYPNAEIGEFRQYVKHGNYGDDFINSVSPERLNFNFLSMQEYLKFFQVKITPGIKEAEGAPFVESLDALVFLQRFSIKLPELPYRVGRLKEASILKSLVCVLRGKGEWDVNFATVQNVDGALREWVYYGREVYEQRRQLMDEILTRNNLRHLSLVVDTPYLELLQSLQSEFLDSPVGKAE